MKIRPLLKLTALTLVCVPLMLTACAGHGGGTGTSTSDTSNAPSTSNTPNTSSATVTDTSFAGTSAADTSAAETTAPLPVEFNIGSVSAGKFTAIYSASAEPEEGTTIVRALASLLREAGLGLMQASDARQNESEHKIFIGRTNDAYSTSLYEAGFGTFDYHLEVKDGNLYLAGGSCFALQYCVNLMRDDYLRRGLSLDDGLVLTGSAYGKQLYALESGADVRIMSNNAWNCDNNQPAWAEMGEDCSAKVRSVGLAGTYMAYAPDVICFQEMTVQMVGLLRREFKNNGWEYGLITYSTSAQNDYTCILYRTDTLELISKGRHQFDYGSDAGSKSYDWGRFRHRATGKEFIALSTHLWWKAETAQAGSDAMRERQAAEIVAEADSLIAKYGVPVWVMGDFNTRTTSAAFRVFTSGGFSDAFDIATVYADDNSGYHTCTRQTFAREKQSKPYKSNAIDHILLKNPGATEVLTFNHVRPYFYIKLSDHYPLFVDAKLG